MFLRGSKVHIHYALHGQTRTASSLLPGGPHCPLSCVAASGATLVRTTQNLQGNVLINN